MKKVLAVIGVVAFSFGAVSCKKECKCNLAGVDFPTTGAIDDKDACDKFSSLYNEGAALAEEMGVPFVKLTCEWK